MWTASTRVYHFYDAFGHVIGGEECEEGKIFIEPQGMCVMAGICVDTGEAVTALQSVKDKLDTKYGILLLHPARDGRLYPAPRLGAGQPMKSLWRTPTIWKRASKP